MIKINLLDKKILNILILNSRLEYSEIARLTGTSTERVFYRINRLFKNGIINEYKVLLRYTELGYNQYNIFIKLKHINIDLREKWKEYFKTHPFTVWVGTCVGEYDFRIFLIAKDHFQLKAILEKIDEDLGPDIASLMILNRIKKYEGSSYLTFRSYSTQKEVDEIRQTLSNMKTEKKDKPITILDGKDMKILRKLCYDPKIKYTEIAKQMKVTPEDIKYRVKKINSTPIIARYSISVNFPKMGLLWLAVLIKITNKNKKKEFIDYALNNPKTVNVIENLGEWDLELTFYAKDIDEVDKYMLDLREKYYDVILDYKFFITKDGLKYPQVAEGVFEEFEKNSESNNEINNKKHIRKNKVDS